MTTISSERYLVDTNILVYGLNKNAALHAQAAFLLQAGMRGNIKICLAHQNLTELTRTLTAVYKMDTSSTFNCVGPFANLFQLITPHPTTFHVFLDLPHKSHGTEDIFDRYLVATMLDNDVQRIITANKKDFSHYPLNEVLDISDIDIAN